MPKILEWPELEEMSKQNLLLLIDQVRATIVYAEHADDALLDIARRLRVDMRE